MRTKSATLPPFLLVHDAVEPCPYLTDQTARLPLRMPLAAITPGDFDRLLDEGDRRTGPFLYRVSCQACSACEALRIPISRFRPSSSQRRTLRRNETEVRIEIGMPRITERHLEIFNRHKRERGLALDEKPTTADDYHLGFVRSCVSTLEISYFVETKLVAVSILDLGKKSASSVYHFFDPDEGRRSLGTFSVLKEIELCRTRGLEFYYLGLYVRNCTRLSYKAGFIPHERLINGAWHEFERSE